MKQIILCILLDDLNPTRGAFAHPYSSTTDVSAMGVLIFTIIALVFILYVVVRVWLSLRKDKVKYGIRKKRIPKK